MCSCLPTWAMFEVGTWVKDCREMLHEHMHLHCFKFIKRNSKAVMYYKKCPLLQVNCLPFAEFGPFRRLPAAVTLCLAGFLFWLFIFQQPLVLRWVSAFFLRFCFSDASATIYSVKTKVKPSFRVSCGLTSSEEAYRSSQFTSQWQWQWNSRSVSSSSFWAIFACLWACYSSNWPSISSCSVRPVGSEGSSWGHQTAPASIPFACCSRTPSAISCCSS